MPDFGDLFAETSRLLRSNIGAFATVVAVGTSVGIAFDLMPLDLLLPGMIIFSLVNLFLQAFVTAAALGLEPARTAGRRLAAMLGLSIMYGLGVTFGIVLLLVPGLILLVRWSISAPALLAEECTVSGSLSRSWKLTGERWWLALPILALIALTYGPLAGLYLVTGYPDSTPAWVSGPVNFYVTLMTAFEWLLAAALYRLLREDDPSGDLPAIFS